MGIVEIVLGLVAVAAIILYLRKNGLPVDVKVWLKRITIEKVLEFVKDAAELTIDGEAKRILVVGQITEFVKTQFNYDLPERYANLIVEYVYNIFRVTEEKTGIFGIIKKYIYAVLVAIRYF